MGLDIEIKRRKNHCCPNCGTMVMSEVMDAIPSNGRCWYEYLEKIGYYVPYEQRTEENDWYGKDRTLDKKEIELLKSFVVREPVPYREIIIDLIEDAQIEDDDVIVNANW